jgi:uncharacterized membrane protein
MDWIEALRTPHIVAGCAALGVLIIPLAAAKGGRAHRRAGWAYVGAMAVVAATGFVISAWRVVYEPRMRVGALFLLYVGVLAFASASTGVRVLRAKGRTGPHRHWFDLGLSGLLLASGLGMLAYGLMIGVPLLAGFSLVGIVVGASQLREWLRPPEGPMHWWFSHMDNMLGSATAALTAFFVVNAGRLGLPSDSLLVWLAPTLVAIPVSLVWTRYYRRRFAARPAAVAA